MYIDSYVQPDPRTAGISIFHDGLPKLASVHCYDRGNIATFGLQSCQPRPLKDPPKLYPIRPVVNHYNSKVPLVNQPRMYNGLPRPRVNQPKMYSGAFYPPGSQPRVQRIDGRPVLLPSTFNNTFIHKECFDPNVNKSNSVVYNGPYPPPNCCMQYAAMDPCHALHDDGSKQPPNMRPDNPNTMPYTMQVDVQRQRMENGPNEVIRGHVYCDVPRDSQHFQRKVGPELFNCENPSMLCNSGNSSVNCTQANPAMICETGNAPIMYKSGNPGLACKYTDVIDLVADEEFKEKCCIKQKQYDGSLTHSPTKYDTENRLNNSSCGNHGYKINTCKSCHQEYSSNNRLTHDTLRTSSPLCNDCGRQNSAFESKRECRSADEPHQNVNIPRVFPRTKSNLTNRSKRPEIINLRDPSCNGINTRGIPERSANLPTSCDNFNGIPTNSSGVLCSYCNKNFAEVQIPSSDKQNLSNTCQTQPACQTCVRSWRRSIQQNIATNVGLHHVNGNDDITKAPIVIDVDKYSKEERKTNHFHGNASVKYTPTGGLNHTHQHMNIRSRSEEGAYINTHHETQLHKKSASVPLMEFVVVKTEPGLEENNNPVGDSLDTAPECCANDDDSLDIDEKSFDTFINNTRSETESPSFHSNNPLDIHDKNYESTPLIELNRKRKSPFMPLNLEKSEDGSDRISNPNSPTYQIDEEQLLRLRNKVTPILKAKKWIRQNSLDTPIDQSSGSFASE